MRHIRFSVREVLGLFVITRLFWVIASSIPSIQGVGDLHTFFLDASLVGWPYFQYWADYPPIIPFCLALLYRISGAQEHVFTYLMVFGLTLADLMNIWLFFRLEELVSPVEAGRKTIFYALCIAVFVYSWWYFEPWVVFTCLLGLWFFLRSREKWMGFTLGVGFLLKMFPAMGLILAWRFWPWRKALTATLVWLGVAGSVYGGLWLVSPQMTQASIAAQWMKGSWGSLWALVDGNYQTGNFGPLEERYQPETALVSTRNPAKLDSRWLLLGFAGLGLWGLWKARGKTLAAQVAVLGWTWALFLLWSPGWSPQWGLYLIPLILLCFTERQGALWVGVWLALLLLEWPILLSRGFFEALTYLIPLRTVFLVLLAIKFYEGMCGENPPDQALSSVQPPAP